MSWTKWQRGSICKCRKWIPVAWNKARQMPSPVAWKKARRKRIGKSQLAKKSAKRKSHRSSASRTAAWGMKKKVCFRAVES